MGDGAIPSFKESDGHIERLERAILILDRLKKALLNWVEPEISREQ